MKQLKLLLSSMFLFTAVIKSAEVGTCTYYGRHKYVHQCIKVTYNVFNQADVVVASGAQDGTNWYDIEKSIQADLNERQEKVDADIAEQKETILLQGIAKEIVGAKISQESK
jgi:hypothetical protein